MTTNNIMTHTLSKQPTISTETIRFSCLMRFRICFGDKTNAGETELRQHGLHGIWNQTHKSNVWTQTSIYRGKVHFLPIKNIRIFSDNSFHAFKTDANVYCKTNFWRQIAVETIYGRKNLQDSTLLQQTRVDGMDACVHSRKHRQRCSCFERKRKIEIKRLGKALDYHWSIWLLLLRSTFHSD